MEKKFKCQSCGTEFMADTNQYVTCPKCDSDNVALSKGNTSIVKILIIIFASLIVIGGAVVAIIKLNGKSSDGATDYSSASQELLIESNSTETDEPKEETVIPIEYEKPEISFSTIGTPAYDSATDTYSISVKATIQGPQSSDYTVNYKVSSIDGSKTIATNNTGMFINLKPIATGSNNPEASYLITALAMKGNECVDSVPTIIPGFKVVSRTLVEKMTVAEAQSLIDNKASATVTANNPKLAANVQIRCNGNTGGEPAPKTLRKLIERLKMSDVWTGARVVSLEYDDNNCVKCIVITPILTNE